jgi:hypothetical protein
MSATSVHEHMDSRTTDFGAEFPKVTKAIAKKQKPKVKPMGGRGTKVNIPPKPRSKAVFKAVAKTKYSKKTRAIASSTKRTSGFDILGDRKGLEKALKFTRACNRVLRTGSCSMENCGFAHTQSQLQPAICVFGDSCRTQCCTRMHPSNTIEQYAQMNFKWAKDHSSLPTEEEEPIQDAARLKYTKACKRILFKGKCNVMGCTFAHTREAMEPPACRWDNECKDMKCVYYHSEDNMSSFEYRNPEWTETRDALPRARKQRSHPMLDNYARRMREPFYRNPGYVAPPAPWEFVPPPLTLNESQRYFQPAGIQPPFSNSFGPPPPPPLSEHPDHRKVSEPAHPIESPTPVKPADDSIVEALEALVLESKYNQEPEPEISDPVAVEIEDDIEDPFEEDEHDNSKPTIIRVPTALAEKAIEAALSRGIFNIQIIITD